MLHELEDLMFGGKFGLPEFLVMVAVGVVILAPVYRLFGAAIRRLER